MNMKGKYNARSPAVKRLMREAMELHEPTDQYYAQPIEDNIFEWHFTVRGAPDTEFANGRYHGRIILPPEYPMKPPSIMLLTPNGRFEIGKKICLSMSAHHPETWQPSWSIRTVLLAIIGFMPSKAEGAIGALEYTSEERRRLAKKSTAWICPSCGSDNSTCLLEGTGRDTAASTAESMEIAGQISFKSAPEENAASKDKSVDPKAAKSDSSLTEKAADLLAAAPTADDENLTQNKVYNGNQDDVDSSVNTNRANRLDGNDMDNDDCSLEGKSTQDPSVTADGVRKRVSSMPHDQGNNEAWNEQSDHKKETSGVCSLVLLWIVVLSLIILIFRRLCMDAMSIGGSK